MASQFREGSQLVDPTGTQIYDSFDHLIVFGKSGKGLGELWQPSCVAIDDETHQIFVGEGWNNLARVSIFSGKGVILSTFKHERLMEPSGIAVHRGNVYVTDCSGHCIVHFKIAAGIFPADWSWIGSRGSGLGQFDGPKRLDISANTDIFVADCYNHRIKILDSSLNCKECITHHSMVLPCDVKLSPDNVFVLGNSSPCVHIFSYAGRIKRSLVTRGNIGMQVISPHFFCLDVNGNLVISDCEDHRVKIFSLEGTLLNTVGGPGLNIGEFSYPQGVAFTKSFKLIVVAKCKNYNLQIFY